MASSTEQQLRDRISASSGTNAAWQGFHVVKDQKEGLRHDVAAVRSHPLITGRAQVAGFIYDVDTGLLNPLTD
jgi:carbonic anhydrase